MNPTARKYIDLFRAVKVASAATVDAQGRPQSRIINVMLALDEGMVIVTSRGKPFWKQLTESGLVALSAMCPECQSRRRHTRFKCDWSSDVCSSDLSTTPA